MRWHICAPGPTLDWGWWRGQKNVICINLALHKAKACAFWTCFDKPNEVHRYCEADYHRLEPVVVTKYKRKPYWREWLGDEADIRDMAPAYKQTWAGKVNKGGALLSIHTATCWAAYQEATVIEYHGVTMEGEGYFEGLDPRREAVCKTQNDRASRAEAWKNRWDLSHRRGGKELRLMRNIWAGAQEAGVVLEGLPAKVTGGQETKRGG